MAVGNVIKVAIVGDAKSLGKATKEGGGFLKGFNSQVKTLSLGVVGAVVGVGAAAYKIGSAFDDSYDKIRIGTGKTGKELAGLQKDFRTVVQDVPTDFGSAAEAITQVQRKLGLTGKPLRDRTEQFLELSRITKTDLGTNLSSVTSLFNNFGLAAKDQGPELDVLFRASQQTGIGVADLAQQMSAGGVVLRSLGFDFNQSAVFLAGLSKAGVDASQVMPAFAKTLATAAKHGKSAQLVYRETFAAIRKAPSDTKAAAIAMDVFGAKAGPKLAYAIRQGKLSFDKLGESIVDGKDTIRKAGSDTEDFAEKWTKFKNRVLVKVAPLAAVVFNKLGEVMDKLPAIIARVRLKGEELTKWAQEHKPLVIAVGAAIAGVLVVAFVAWAAAAAVAAFNTLVAVAPLVLIGAAVGLIGLAVVKNWDTIKQWALNVKGVALSVWGVIQSFVDGIVSLWHRFGGVFITVAKQAFTIVDGIIRGGLNIIMGVFRVFKALFTGDWQGLWDGIKQIFQGVVGVLGGVARSVVLAITGPFRFIYAAFHDNMDNVVNFASKVVRLIADAFAPLGNILLAPFKWAFGIIKDIYDHSIGPIVGVIAGLLGDGGHRGPGGTISFPGGGIPVVPRHHSGGIFDSGRGEGLAWLRDGEGIFTPEQMAALGGGGGTLIQNFPAGIDPAAVVAAQRRWNKRNGRR